MEFSTHSLASFTAVANTGSVAAAAHRLNVAGSVISRNIKRMEDQLGVQLFDRSVKGMKLTPSGRYFAAYVRRARLDQEEAVAQLRRRSQEIEGHIRIAAIEGLSIALVPQLVAQFQMRHAKVTFSMATWPQAEIFRQIQNGDADLALTFEGRSDAEVQTLYHKPFRSYALMAPDHPLAAETRLSMEMLSHYPLTGSRETTTGHLHDRVTSLNGVRMEYGLITANTTTMYSYCRASEAINFSAWASCYGFVRDGLLVARDFEGSALMVRNVSLAVMQGREIPRHLASFIDFAQQEIDQLEAEAPS